MVHRTRGAGPRRVGSALALALLALAAAPAAGHVAPAVDENNRYLKLTPMGDRVRLAYTIFLGERPGAALRRRLDRDRDGQLSTAEARAYGEELAAMVRPAVEVTLGGRPATIAWTTVDVGLGTPSVAAGAFSVDLVGWLCTSGREPHLRLVDRVRVDRPGETEVRLEDGPGVRFVHKRLGDRAMDGLTQTWTGADGPLTVGLDVRWTVDASAPRPADGRCGDAAASPPRRWPWLAGLALALAAGGALLARRRERAQRNVNG